LGGASAGGGLRRPAGDGDLGGLGEMSRGGGGGGDLLDLRAAGEADRRREGGGERSGDLPRRGDGERDRLDSS